MNKQDIAISIATSLIASLVFWVGFNLIPFICKYIRIRPRIESDINEIGTHLFSFIEVPFLQSVHSPSDFQKEIKGRKMCKKDFENALYGKCLSKDQCINEFEHRLLPVSEKLESRANELDKRLDRIQRYSSYLKTKEVLLLKEIGERIHAYEFVDHKDIVDGFAVVSVNPTISYMQTNFYMLYSLYHKLNDIIDSFHLFRRSDFERYRIAREKLETKHYVSYFMKWIFANKKYKVLLEVRNAFLQGNKEKTKKKLKEYLELDNEKLIYLRGYLDYLDSEEEYIKFMINIRGEKQVQEWLSCVNLEIAKKRRFKARNAENKKMIFEMEKNAPKITDLDKDKIRIVNKLFDGYL